MYDILYGQYPLSLWSGVAKDDVDPEHLHDDRTKRKRYTEREEPQPSYAETCYHFQTGCWDGKEYYSKVEDDGP